MPNDDFLRFLDEYIGKLDKLLSLLNMNPMKYSEKIKETQTIRATSEMFKREYLSSLKSNIPDTTIHPFELGNLWFSGSSVDKF